LTIQKNHGKISGTEIFWGEFMFVSESLGINEKNELTIGGISTVELAKKYGTPLYVMDEDGIRRNCRIYKEAISKYYGGRGLIVYASKAFSSLEMMRIVQSEGLGVDVVSGGELYTALKAGVDSEKICFHGNFKTDEELIMAVENNVGRVVVDNLYELFRLNDFAKEKGKIVNILFRIKPGIEAHTHEFISTGQIDSKFGVALETGEAMDFVKTALELSNVKLVGIHCHIGSQIFELEPFRKAAEVMLSFIGDVLDKFGYKINELNLGGGYGVMYTKEDDPVKYDEYIKKVSEVITELSEKRGIERPFILMEPGRSIVATEGITLYTVGPIKEIPNVRKYVAVDGGMGDNPRYILYGAKYWPIVANRVVSGTEEVVTIAGRCCESGDLLAKDVKLGEVKEGDILAILSTGAYNYSMSSNYNRIPRPAVVMVKNGESRIIVMRETYEDIIRNDL